MPYLDHAASTPMFPEAVDAMLPHLRGDHANPSGAHTLARVARRAIDESRDTMAEVLGAEPREIVFTGGGTEADNLAVLGVLDRLGGDAVCSAVEHHAVLDAVHARDGRTVAVDARGIVDLDALAETLGALGGAGTTVSVVSVMLANNEVGSIQPIDQVARCVRALAPDAVIHTDAVQSVPWLDVARATKAADLVSVSAHKFGGPKGVGALVVREGAADRLAARSFGGGQERERRSGTQNVAGIVGMAVAARLAVEQRPATTERVAKLRDRLADGLLVSVPDTIESGVATGADGLAEGRDHLLPSVCHVCFDGVLSESLLFLLEREQVFASAASSCASGAQEPSHVLAAMGVPRAQSMGALRLSLGWSSTEADVDAALAAIPPAVARLRSYA